MLQKKDFSLSKDFNFDEDLDRIYGEYEAINVSGHFFKNLLQYYMKIYKGVCGETDDINKVYEAVQKYSSVNVLNDDYSFTDEAEKLKKLHLSAKEHSRVLDELSSQLEDAIDSWIDGLSSDKLSNKERAKDLEFVARTTLLFNRREFIHETCSYTSHLMRGILECEDESESKEDNVTFGAVELPLFTHIPVVEDISQETLDESRLMQILFNIIEQDSYPPMMMLHDCNNGDAIVRLWKKENGEDTPCLFKIKKIDVYLDKIGFHDEKAMWPGIIEAAVALMGCSDEELPYAILGPKLGDYDLTAILGPNIAPTYKTSTAYNDMIQEYITCYFNAYSSLIATDSIVIEDTIEFTKLLAAVWEVIYALTCSFDRAFDLINPAIEFLRAAIAEYRKFVQENPSADYMANKRIAICDTIEELNKLATEESEDRKAPRLYFGKILAEKVADVILEFQGKEKTQQAHDAKVKELLNKEKFNHLVSKTNIHEMRTANKIFATSVLEKLKE